MAPSRSRPAFFCAVLAALLGSAPRVRADAPPPTAAQPASPQGSDPFSEAPAVVEQVCADIPAKCPDHRALLSEEVELHGDIKACLSAACAFDKLFGLDGRVAALNEAILTLMSQVGDAADDCHEIADHQNIFYRMQSVQRSDLSEAWAANAAAASAVPNPVSKDALSAAADVCSANPADDSSPCSLAKIVALEAQEFETLNAQCAKTPCPWSQSKQLLSDFLLLENDFTKLNCIAVAPPLRYPQKDYLALNATVVKASYVIDLTYSGVTGGMKDAAVEEVSLESDIQDAMARVQAGGSGALTQADLSSLESRLTKVGGNVDSKALMVDRMSEMMTFGQVDGKSGKSVMDQYVTPLRERVNQESQVFAGLRASLRSLRIAAGLPFAPGDNEPSLERDSAPRAAAGTLAAKTPTAPSTPLQLQQSLDKKSVPAPLPASVPPPPILPDSESTLKKLSAASDPVLLPVVEADMLRRAGLTRTVGNPGGRAGLVYQQDSPDTCGLVAQQEILRAYGKIPEGDPERQQASLRDQAIDDGLFSRGTPTDLSGALLEKNWIMTKVEHQASIADLNAAVMTGDFVIVSVDARPLWNMRLLLDPNHAGTFDASAPLPHNIVITGAETARGVVVGYYVNDSGEQGQMAYFVPAATFQQAWNGNTRSFVQVLP